MMYSPIVRTAIDTTPLAFPPSGIRSYAEALLSNLDPDSGIEVTQINAANSRTSILPRRAQRLWWDAIGSSLSTPDDVDVLHVLHGSAPIRSSKPLVVTLHDLIPFTDPHYRHSRSMQVYQGILDYTLPRADAIITPSQYIANEAMERWEQLSDRIHVVPMAVDGRYQPAQNPDCLPASIEALGIQRPYVFNVGGFDERKNLPILVAAFAQFRRIAGPEYRLIIAGAPHTANTRVYPPLTGIIEELGLSSHVVLPGFVSEETKIALYQHAAMYVTPSRSEGFGITCLEAMACGTPVIASTSTSLPEVAGDAAMLVEPQVDAVAQAMIELFENQEAQDALRHKGIARARAFSWSRTATMTADVYRSVHGSANPNARY